MNTGKFRSGLRAFIFFSTILLALTSAARARTNISLDGIFETGKWRVRLNAGSGAGTFLTTAAAGRKPGDIFLKTRSRSAFDTWAALVYDRTFSAMQEGSVAIRGDRLIVTPKKGTAYVLTRVIPPASGNGKSPGKTVRPAIRIGETEQKGTRPPSLKNTGSGSGCTVVQCSGTTKAGSRCRRSTSNCSGYCWQHQ